MNNGNFLTRKTITITAIAEVVNEKKYYVLNAQYSSQLQMKTQHSDSEMRTNRTNVKTEF